MSFINYLLAMVNHAPKRLLMLAALLCMALPSFAYGLKQAQPATCKQPEYPRRAQKAGEEGVSLLGFLVRGDGTVASSVVLNSSGSQELDRIAADALSKCVFRRPANSDDATEHWVRLAYTWDFNDGPGMLRAKQAAALAAGKGSLPARYHLSLLLSQTAETDADREKGLLVLRSSAELGHAPAQFDLGRRYEKGVGVETNLDEAVRWYQKSAAQGDPLATQRLRLGLLPD
ncbi:TonB family protein [Massilia niabensis]|uniref:TonB family protein n=1 Tax=Massilia niabensis TaxID=544910 RepID=A0ABW0LAU3_9BURK